MIAEGKPTRGITIFTVWFIGSHDSITLPAQLCLQLEDSAWP